jgi:hypothetical protein
VCVAAHRTDGPDPSSSANPPSPSKPWTEPALWTHDEERVEKLRTVIRAMPQASSEDIKRWGCWGHPRRGPVSPSQFGDRAKPGTRDAGRPMSDALIAGRLYGAPQQRTTKTGKAFVTGKLRVSVANGETAFISFICFAPPAVAAILALQDGDSVALSGEATPKAWIDKEGQPRAGLDLVAHVVLTSYAVTRKRQPVRKEASVG